MEDDVVVGLLALTSAVVGGLLTAGASFLLQRQAARERLSAEVRAEALAAVDGRREALERLLNSISTWFHTVDLVMFVGRSTRARPWWKPLIPRGQVKDRILRLWDDRDAIAQAQLVLLSRCRNPSLDDELRLLLDLVDELMRAETRDVERVSTQLIEVTERLARWDFADKREAA